VISLCFIRKNSSWLYYLAKPNASIIARNLLWQFIEKKNLLYHHFPIPAIRQEFFFLPLPIHPSLSICIVRNKKA